MTLTDLLTELLAQVNPAPPTAAMLEAHFAPRAARCTKAGDNLEPPAWARLVTSAHDAYLTLGGDVHGMHLSEDPRGWGAYVNLSVARGSLADIERVLGPAAPMARAPDDFRSGPKLAIYVPRGDKTVRVFIELTGAGADSIRRVTVHFQR